MKNYEKKYKEALQRAKDLHDYHALGQTFTYITCEKIFPELKDSEDEKIRKGIIEYLEQSQFGEDHYLIDDDIVRGYIAWLEKQKEDNDKFNEKQDKQKSAEWSEEDKGMLNSIIDRGLKGHDLYPDQVIWLKHLLKTKVLPQPKQE